MKNTTPTQSTAEQERARIVAWLRMENRLCDCFARSVDECGCGAWDDWKTRPLLDIADDIERGEYLTDHKSHNGRQG